MDDIRLRLSAAVAAQLNAAPASKEKDELIEELSDNLYRRFLEMTGAGVPEEKAFQQAMDGLGDVDELLAYLGVEPDPDLKISIEPDGSGVTIQGKDGKPIIINTGDPAADEERARADEEQAEADEKRARADGRGGVHYNYSGQIPQSDLEIGRAHV